MEAAAAMHQVCAPTLTPMNMKSQSRKGFVSETVDDLLLWAERKGVLWGRGWGWKDDVQAEQQNRRHIRRPQGCKMDLRAEHNESSIHRYGMSNHTSTPPWNLKQTVELASDRWKIITLLQKSKGTFQHSSFLAGGATSAAGRLVVENGILRVHGSTLPYQPRSVLLVQHPGHLSDSV